MKEKLLALKNRVFENFKKNKYILLGFSIIWIVLIIITLSSYDTTLGKSVLGNESYQRDAIRLDENTTIVQELPLKEDTDCISILFATYARNNNGIITISIDGITSGKNYYKENHNVKNILDNVYLTVRTNEKIDHLKEKIRITITSNSKENEAIAVYRSTSKEIEDGLLMVNGKIIEDSDLSVKYLYEDELLKTFSNAVIIWSIIGLSFIALIVLLVNPKPEITFALMTFILGLIMMIIINPSSPPDELAHYEATLGLSNKMMFVKDYNLIDSSYVKYGYMYGHYNISPGYVRFMNEINQPQKLTGEMVALSRNIDDYYFIQYIPNAIGITLGRLLHLNMITTFYLGRMTGLLFYVICVYIAIKNAYSFKFLLGIIACLPMFLQIAISITYDNWINALSFLTIGYFLKWYFNDELIDKKELVFVFLINFGLAPAKVLYSFFAFLFLFVQASRYGGKRNKILISLALIAPGTYQLYDIMKGPITLFFHKILSANIENNMLDASGVINKNVELLTNRVGPLKDVYTFSYMIRNPIETLIIFARTIRYKIKFWFYGSIGRSLSGDTLILPIRLVHFLVLAVVASAFVKTDYTFNIPMKLLLITLCVVVGLYALIGMFVSWTDPNQEIIKDYGGVIIEGIQGRYFSPLLPYFFPIISNKKVYLPKESDKYIILIYIMIFFEVVIYVLSYTFVN